MSEIRRIPSGPGRALTNRPDCTANSSTRERSIVHVLPTHGQRRKMPVVSAAERERLQILGAFLEQQIRAAQIGANDVFWNVPPAVARHFRFGP